MSDDLLLDVADNTVQPTTNGEPKLELKEDGDSTPAPEVNDTTPQESTESSPRADSEVKSEIESTESSPRNDQEEVSTNDTPVSSPEESPRDVPEVASETPATPEAAAETPETKEEAPETPATPETSETQVTTPETQVTPEATPETQETTETASEQQDTPTKNGKVSMNGVNHDKETEEEEEKTETPLDPRLEEIKEKFGGKWKMVRSDPYGDYLKSLGVGFFGRWFAGRAAHEMEFLIEKENKIVIVMRSFFHSQHYTFKLDEETENLVEKFKHGVVCSYEDGKLVQNMTPLDIGSMAKQNQHVERHINENGEQEVVFTAGEHVCRRYYVRLEDLNKKPASKVEVEKEKEKTDEKSENKSEDDEKTNEKKEEENTESKKDENTTEVDQSNKTSEETDQSEEKKETTTEE